MLGLLPTGLRLWGLLGAAAAILALGVALWFQIEANGALKVRLANAQAIVDQREADMRLSALAVAKLQGALEKAESTIAPVRTEIIRVPVTTSCGPAIAAAVAGVRAALSNPR